MHEPQSVRVNDQLHDWSPGLTVAALLQRRGDAPDSVATALNGAFVAREARERTALEPGDQITLFKPIVGG